MTRKLKHLIITMVVILCMSIIFPQSTFFVLLASLIINIISSDYSGKQSLVEIASPKRMIYKRKIANPELSNQSIEEITPKIRDETANLLIQDKTIDRAFIESLNHEESYGLIISIQEDSGLFSFDSKLTNYHFKELAGKAVKCSLYRNILIRNSFRDIGLHESKSLEKLSLNVDFVIGDDLKKISDSEFNRKIKESNQDKLTVFSTTSQLSSDLIDILEEYPHTIEKLDFYICSPFVRQDSAIRQLENEYRGPKFSIPDSQFITSNDGKVNIEIDSLRRILKILSSISRLKDLALRSEKTIKVFLFRNKYPGIKIKLLSNKNFLQIQPGPLAYANNMYRFGISTSDSEICGEIDASLNEFKDRRENVTEISLSDFEFNDFRVKVIREAALWLTENGVSSDEIDKYRKDINLSIKDVAVNTWIESISSLVNHARYSIEVADLASLAYKKKLSEKVCENGDSGIYSEKLPNFETKHVTVAMLLVKDDKVVLAKKSDPAYGGKYSIIAGHVDNNESPLEAIIREVEEEAGLKIRDPQFVMKMENVRDKCRYGGVLHDWYVFHTTEPISYDSLKIDENEISAIEMVHISDLNSYAEKMTFGCKKLFESLGYVS